MRGNAPSSPPLALRQTEAARSLGISPRKLWDLLHPRGPIRTFKLGTAVLVPVSELEKFIEAELAKSAGATEGRS